MVPKGISGSTHRVNWALLSVLLEKTGGQVLRKRVREKTKSSGSTINHRDGHSRQNLMGKRARRKSFDQEGNFKCHLHGERQEEESGFRVSILL